MSEREWQRGLPRGAHGTDRNNQRPGRERLTEEVDALIAEYGSTEPTPPNPLEGLPTPDELRNLSEAVVSARNRLAELSIARRQLIRKQVAKLTDSLRHMKPQKLRTRLKQERSSLPELDTIVQV